MALYYGMWHGGATYSQSYDREAFNSMAEVRAALRDRYESDGRYPMTVRPTDGHGLEKETQEMFMPGVDLTSYIDIFRKDVWEDQEMLCRVEFGPRGGVHIALC